MKIVKKKILVLILLSNFFYVGLFAKKGMICYLGGADNKTEICFIGPVIECPCNPEPGGSCTVTGTDEFGNSFERTITWCNTGNVIPSDDRDPIDIINNSLNNLDSAVLDVIELETFGINFNPELLSDIEDIQSGLLSAKDIYLFQLLGTPDIDVPKTVHQVSKEIALVDSDVIKLTEKLIQIRSQLEKEKTNINTNIISNSVLKIKSQVDDIVSKISLLQINRNLINRTIQICDTIFFFVLDAVNDSLILIIKSAALDSAFCPIILGSLTSHPSCNGDVVQGDSIVLLDSASKVVSQVGPVISDKDGHFSFNPFEIAFLDSFQLFTFGIKNGFSLQIPGFKTIQTWVNESPISLILSNVDQAWAAHLGDLPDTSATLDTVKFKAATAIAVNGNAHVTGFINKEAGFTTGQTKFVTVTYGRDGDTLWVKEFGSASPGVTSIPLAIAVNPACDVYVTGVTDAAGHADFLTIKYDSSGNLQWSRTFDANGNFDQANAIAVDEAGNIYVTGMSDEGLGDGPAHGLDAAFDIAADRDGNVYVTGISQDTTLTQAAFSFSFGTNIANTAFVVGSGFAIASSFPPPPVDVGPSPADATTVMYDTDGNELWVERFKNPEPGAWSGGVGIGLDDEAGVYVTGFSAQVNTASSTTGVKITTVKYEHCIPVSGPELANSGEASSGSDKTVDESGVTTETTTEITIYPNPYSGKTNIAFSLAEPAHVKLEVLTVLGQKIAEITDGRQAAGSYHYSFSAASAGFGKGVYVLRLTVNGEAKVVKLIER